MSGSRSGSGSGRGEKEQGARGRGRERTMRMWASVYSGFQSFLRVDTQISPDLETLGWKMGVVMRQWGGTTGYSGVKLNAMLKYPEAYGVSAISGVRLVVSCLDGEGDLRGPWMHAEKASRSASSTATRTPSGGLLCSATSSMPILRSVRADTIGIAVASGSTVSCWCWSFCLSGLACARWSWLEASRDMWSLAAER